MITGLSDTLKIIATDYGFKPDTTLVVVVNGVTTHADTLTLLDTLAPWITRTGASVIKSGGSSSLHIAARDTFYTTDTLQADFGAGYRTITNPLDTSVSYSSYGDHFVRIRAVDVNGNVRRDSTNVHVNLPPNVPVRVWPSVGQKIEINTPVSFYWNGGDPDNAANVRYDLFVGTSRTISAANRVAQAINDTSYLSIWNSGESRIPYFWRVAASDGYDTTWSTVDSFNVGKYTSTRIYGYARLEGVQRHNGIKVTLTGLQTYSVQTDSLGSVSIEVNPGTYTITAADTLRGVFSTATGSATGNANDSATFGTIVLHDSDNPVIACSSPAQNAALTSLNPRTITVTGTFSDVGSQVHVDSVRATLNGVPVTGLIKSSSAWQFTMSNVADGHYTVRVDAADSAGNSATQLVRAFTVNSKSISALKRFHHDTMYCTASVANVLPPIRAYYWNFRSHASSAWSDSSITSADTAAKTFPWPASFSNGPDTLIVMAVDDSGMAVYDTVPYTVSADTPVASAGADTVLAMGTSSSPLLLHGSYEQQFGHAARFDWSINNGGSSFTRTSTPDTTVNFSASYSAGIMCVFKVTDDAAVPNVSYDTMYVGIGRTWTPVGAADITTSSTSYTNFSLGVYSDNEMYLALSDASTWKIKVMKWDGSSWATVGSGFSTGSADRMQVAIGTGFGYGGAQYSVPYVGFWDGGASRVRVCKPTGDTVGAQSLCAGKFHSYFRLAIPTGGGTSTVYLADNDSLSANRVKVRKYYSGVYNWDSIAVSGGPSGPSVRDFSTDGTAYYLLTHTSSADTLKKLNGSVWQTVGSYTNANHPVLYCAGSSSLYMADQDGSYSNRLTVKQYNGSSWSLVGGAPVSKNTVWNTTFATMGSIALQATGGYPCVAYPEVDDDNLNDTLRVKAFDGTSWRTVGVEGLPITGISINKASFCVKNGRMYLACRNSSTSQITVYQLR
jgi:hypothetical protein